MKVQPSKSKLRISLDDFKKCPTKTKPYLNDIS